MLEYNYSVWYRDALAGHRMFRFFLDRPILYLAPIVAFFLGWIYLNEYFATLSVSRRDLGLNVYDIYVYAFAPFLSFAQTRELSGWVFVVASIVLGVVYGAQRETASVRRRLLTLLAFLFFVGSTYGFASSTGENDARQILRGCVGKAVVLTFGPNLTGDDKVDAALTNANSEFRLRLLWQAEDYVYVLPLAQSACLSPADYAAMLKAHEGSTLPTYELKRADITYMRMVDYRVGG